MVFESKHPKRIGFVVFWLGADCKVIRSHYFETNNYTDAKRKVWRKYHNNKEDKNEVCGFFLTDANSEIISRFYNRAPWAKPRSFTEIESHMYAPPGINRHPRRNLHATTTRALPSEDQTSE